MAVTAHPSSQRNPSWLLVPAGTRALRQVAAHSRMENPLTMDQELQELLQEFYATRAAPRPHSRPHFLDPQIGPCRYIARSQSRPSLWLSRAYRLSWPQRLSSFLAAPLAAPARSSAPMGGAGFRVSWKLSSIAINSRAISQWTSARPSGRPSSSQILYARARMRCS